MSCAASEKQLVAWTDEQIRKQSALLNEHLKKYKCRDCMRKHSILIEGYCLENAQFTGNSKYLKLARKMRLFRKSLGDGGTPA